MPQSKRRPRKWSEVRVGRTVRRRDDLVVQFPPSQGQPRSIQADNPFSTRSSTPVYYELEIEHMSKTAVIALGFADERFRLIGSLCGEAGFSFAVHSTGTKHSGTTEGATFTEPFKEGDVVGIGMNKRQQIFFTKNGEYVGVAFAKATGLRPVPTVSCDDVCKVKANFGVQGVDGFKFNVHCDDVETPSQETTKTAFEIAQEAKAKEEAEARERKRAEAAKKAEDKRNSPIGTRRKSGGFFTTGFGSSANAAQSPGSPTGGAQSPSGLRKRRQSRHVGVRGTDRVKKKELERHMSTFHAEARAPGQVAVVRVFVSTDKESMAAEREVIADVFAELNERYRDRYVELVPVEHVWGADPEDEARVLRETMDELARCSRKPGEAPWYLSLRGARYGFVPPEFNAPTAFRHPDTMLWLADEVEHYPVTPSLQTVEVMHAVKYAPFDAVTGCGSHAFVYFREPKFVDDVPADKRWLFELEYKAEAERDKLPDALHAQYRFVESAAADAYARATEDFADEIKSYSQDGRLVWSLYGCTFGKDGDGSGVRVLGTAPDGRTLAEGRVGGLDELRTLLLSDLTDQIEREFPPLTREAHGEDDRWEIDWVQQRGALSNLLAAAVVVREAEMTKLKDYVEQQSKLEVNPTPMIVHGPRGVGKTSLLAKWWNAYTSGGTEQTVFVHVVGSTQRSLTLRNLLQKLAHQLRAELGSTEHIPEQMQGLQRTFTSLVERVCEKKLLVIVLDAVNHLTEEDQSQWMKWIPTQLPARARLILSVTSDSEALAHLREHKPAPLELELSAFSEAQVQAVVRTLGPMAKDTAHALTTALLAKRDGAVPLYLRGAMQELRTVLVEGDASVVAFAQDKLPDTLEALYTNIFVRAEHEHGRELVEKILSLIAASKSGMQETELMSIMKDHQFTEEEEHSNLARVMGTLDDVIITSGEGALTLCHDEVKAIAVRRYLNTDVRRNNVHDLLADKFLQLVDPAGDRTFKGHHARSLLEVPYHYAAAKRWQKLESLLTDLGYVEMMCQEGISFDLEVLYLRADAEVGSLMSQTFHDYYRFFSINVATVSTMPDMLYTLAINHPDDTAVAKAAKERWANGYEARPYLRWVGKPTLLDPCLQVLDDNDAGAIHTAEWGDNGLVLTLHEDKNWRLWDPRTGREVLCAGKKDTEYVAGAWSPDCTKIATGASNNTLRLWDATTGLPLHDLDGHKLGIFQVTFSPDGALLASTSFDRTLKVWGVDDGKLRFSIDTSYIGEHTAIFSADSKMLYSFSTTASAPLVINVEKARRTAQLTGVSGGRTVARHDKLVAIGGKSGDVRLLDVSTNKVVTVPKDSSAKHKELVTCVAFSHDGATIASAAKDGTINIIDIASAKVVAALVHAPDVCVTGVSFSRDDQNLVSAGKDGIIKVWDATPQGDKKEAIKHDDAVNCISFASDGKRMASAGGQTVIVWNTRDQSDTAVLQHGAKVWCANFSPSGRQLVVGLDDSSVVLWNVEIGANAAKLKTLQGHSCPVPAAFFSPDGERIVSLGSDGSMKLWDPQAKKASGGMEAGSHSVGRSGNVHAVSFSPDGRRVVLSVSTAAVLSPVRSPLQFVGAKSGGRIASPSTKAPSTPTAFSKQDVATFTGNSGARFPSSFTADGEAMLTQWRDTLVLWNAQSGEKKVIFKNKDTSPVTVTCINKRGDVAFSGHKDGTLRVWDSRLGTPRRTLPAHSSAIVYVALLPDDNLLVSASIDCSVRVWNLAEERVMCTFLARAPITAMDVNRQTFMEYEGGRLALGDNAGHVYMLNLVSKR